MALSSTTTNHHLLSTSITNSARSQKFTPIKVLLWVELKFKFLASTSGTNRSMELYRTAALVIKLSELGLIPRSDLFAIHRQILWLVFLFLLKWVSMGLIGQIQDLLFLTFMKRKLPHTSLNQALLLEVRKYISTAKISRILKIHLSLMLDLLLKLLTWHRELWL